MDNLWKNLLFRKYDIISEQIVEEPSVEKTLLGKVQLISMYLKVDKQHKNDSVLDVDMQLLPSISTKQLTPWSFDNVLSEWWLYKKANEVEK